MFLRVYQPGSPLTGLWPLPRPPTGFVLRYPWLCGIGFPGGGHLRQVGAVCLQGCSVTCQRSQHTGESGYNSHPPISPSPQGLLNPGLKSPQHRGKNTVIALRTLGRTLPLRVLQPPKSHKRREGGGSHREVPVFRGSFTTLRK